MRKRRPPLDKTGRPTGDTITRYTEGDCWHLAFVLGRTLNAPLVAIALERDPEDWVHVSVDLGRERLVDVLGVRTRDETMLFWHTRVREPLVFRELGRHHSLEGMLSNLDDCRLDMMLTQQDEEDCAAVAAALAEQARPIQSEKRTNGHEHYHVHGGPSRVGEESLGARPGH